MEKEITVIVKLAGNVKMLQRTLDALIGQTMEFESDIQVILYGDDGFSSDYQNCCREYCSSYPKNIYLQKELNLKEAEGKFFNCLQEGQYWHKEAFANAKVLYDNQIDKPFVIEDWYEVPEDGEVYEDYCLHMRNHVEKVSEEPGCYLFHRSYAKQLSKLIHAGKKLDAVLVLLGILLDAGNLGILKNTKMYGKRTVYAAKTKEWYLSELPEFASRLEEMKQGEYQDYAQNLDFFLMYQVADALKEDITGLLNEQEIESFRAWLKELLLKVDDYVIVKGKMNGVTRRYALSLKYGGDITNKLVYRKGKLLFDNMVIYNLKQSVCFQVEEELEKGSETVVRGVSNHPLKADAVEFYYSDGVGKEYPFVSTGQVREEKTCAGIVMQQKLEYECHIPTSGKKEELVLMYRYMGIYAGEVQTEG